jgi:hypothetical protein
MQLGDPGESADTAAAGFYEMMTHRGVYENVAGARSGDVATRYAGMIELQLRPSVG